MAPPGLFYARLEDRDWKFLKRLGTDPPFDAAIVKAPYLAPYPKDDSRHGEDADRLTQALVKKEWDWALDPSTAAHAHPRAAEWTSSRAKNCSLAQALPMPWTPEQLRDQGLAADLVEQAVSVQITSRAIAAPYLEVGGHEDPAIEANCNLLSLVAERAGDQRVLGYLQTLGSRLLDGSAAVAAERIVAAGAETIFIRIRRFDPEKLDHVLAYLELVERIEALGARAVADSVGHFGVVAVADGAYAFSAGARFFRKVPDALLQRPSERSEEEGEEEKDSGGGPPILYELPGQLDGVHRDEAGAHLTSCPDPTCDAEDGKGKARHLRTHNFHEFRRQARLAATQGLDFAETLRAIASPTAVLWAEALEQRAAYRRAA
jgi:hypothetical protein